jgi:diguanylate cyclase (GGDEF)-like protein
MGQDYDRQRLLQPVARPMTEAPRALVPPARLPPRRSRLLPLVALGLGGTAALLAGVWQTQSESRHAAEAALGRAAAAAAREAERTLGGVEARQLALAAWLRGAGATSVEELRRRMVGEEAQALLAVPGGPPLAVLDAEARPIGRAGAPADAAALGEALREIRAGAARALGPPAPGGQALPLLRRLEAPGGELLGVALGMADLAVLAGLQERFAAATGGSLRIAAPDAATPEAAEETPGLPSWLRLSAEQQLASFPLALRAEAPLEAALAPWRDASALVLGGALLVLAGFAGALRQARSGGRAAEAAEAERMAALAEASLATREAAEERQAHRRELEAQAAALGATLGSMSQGLLTFGRHARLVLANHRCAELVGIPLEALRPGATFAAIAHAVRETGDAGAAALLDRLLPVVVRREAASFLHQLDPRRSLLVVHRPLPDGGWLATFEDTGALRAAELRLKEATRNDALTDLPHAATLREEMAAKLAAIAVQGGDAALLLLNLDRFRGVNEALGRAVGDALLQAVAKRLLRFTRRTRGEDLVGRLGADEFAVLAVGNGTGDAAANAAGIAERLVAELGRPFEVQGYRVVTTVSIGIAPFPGSGADAAELLDNAALAMRTAKGAGRGGYAFYAPEMTTGAHLRRLAELDLRMALTEGAGRAFEVRYRPVVDLPSRRVVGLEALLCWVHPVYGLVEPEVLLPLAADLGLAAPLGRLLVRRACTEAAPWSDRRRLSIPLSAAQLLDPGLVERVASAAMETAMTGGRLEILVREADVLGAPEPMLDTIARLRAGGVRVVLDELGATAPTPAALRAAPFDRARLAPGLVRELGGRGHGVGILRAMSDLCAAYGIPLAAGGVETEEQLQQLAAERCTQAAGPLFGAAVPAAELPALFTYLGATA